MESEGAGKVGCHDVPIELEDDRDLEIALAGMLYLSTCASSKFSH
jgi:hypothetical protein